MESKNPRPWHRAPAHRPAKADGGSSGRTGGSRGKLCLGPSGEPMPNNRPPGDAADARSRSKDGRGDLRARYRAFNLRSADCLGIHENGRFGSSGISENGRSELQEAETPQKWIPPPEGAYKINIDGTYALGSLGNSIARICRDSGGRMVGGTAESVRASSPLMAETLALWEAITSSFLNRNFRHLNF